MRAQLHAGALPSACLSPCCRAQQVRIASMERPWGEHSGRLQYSTSVPLHVLLLLAANGAAAVP